MSDSLTQLRQMYDVEALETQLTQTSERARAVHNLDAVAYDHLMVEVRHLIGQLAIALEVQDRSHERARAEVLGMSENVLSMPSLAAHVN